MSGTGLALALDRLELGKLYFKLVDFDAAISALESGLAQARSDANWSSWCRYLPLLLRIQAERFDFTAVERLKSELEELKRSEKLELNSATCYTLGIAATYEAKLDAAEEYFSLAHEMAAAPHETAQARFGLAAVESQRRSYQTALTKLDSLQEDLRSTLLTDLKLATGLLSAFCHRHLGEIEQAFQLLSPLQEMCKVEQNLYMSLNVLFCYGTLHQQRQERESARQYYKMVESLLVPRDLPHLAMQVEAKLKELESQTQNRPAFELVEERFLITPAGKKVAFRNQFILISLFKMLALTPGRILGKEDITRLLWKEEYNPLVHDNKIYVTIRRLRQMIEPDLRRPAYILNAPDGYQFNPAMEFKVKA